MEQNDAKSEKKKERKCCIWEYKLDGLSSAPIQPKVVTLAAGRGFVAESYFIASAKRVLNQLPARHRIDTVETA